MNKKKMSKRQRDIKSKLMAAIAMLLVSSIMMVSTTYAWFTLSTAPEVTGITTAVGANGNLEIALQNPEGTDPAPSAEGDANKSLAERNLTWGNLVDVSDESVYGLNLISLYPAKLNYGTDTTEGKKTVGSKPLSTPVYGADGRVANLEAKTLTGIFDAPRGQFSEMTDEENLPKVQYGVRAVGVSSDLTARNMAYRTAVADAAAAKSQAVNTAKISMANEGSNLANIAVKHALDQDSSGYSAEEMGYLKKALTDLDNAMASLETSLRQSVIANSIATATDDGYTEIITAINNCTTLSDLIAAATTNSNIKLPTFDNGLTFDGESGIATKLATSRSKVSAALTTVNNLITADTFPVQWNSFSSALDGILNTATMKVNGMTITQIQGDGLNADDGVDGKSELINAVLANNSTALLTMESGSGAYSDIADFAGEYSGSFKMLVSYGSLTNVPVNAVMTATPTASGTVYLDHLSVAAYVAGTGGTSAAGTPISEYYGYILDLAFRTNAAGSSLKLQQQGIQRIYNGEGENASTNSATQGGGASMTFESADTSFGLAQVRNLMANLRLVFFDSDTNEIKTYGRLDMATAVDEGSKVTAYIYLTDADGNPQTGEGEDAPYIIMDLTQNEVHELSVMVYLDGESVENADVAATATKSMTGIMNLQFSSTADLKPMDYSELKTEGGGSENTVITINDVTAPTGFTASSTYVMNKTLYFGLAGTVEEGNKVYVSVDGGAYAEAAIDQTLTDAAAAQGQTGVSIYKLAGMADTVTKDSKVLIAVAASTPATPTPDEGTEESTPTATTYTVSETNSGSVKDLVATAAEKTAYTFTLNEGYTLGSVMVGSTAVTTEAGTLTDNGSGSYTINADSVTGNIVITATTAETGA